MAKDITQMTRTTVLSDSDLFYVGRDPGGSPLDRANDLVAFQRYLPMPQSSISGLGLANNVTDANNDIDFAAGRALADSGDYNIISTSALVKQLDATWAVGTNQGGLDAGSKAVSTWYHTWAIARPDTHVSDRLYSLSATAPTMPANYTKKRRIGAIKTDSSGNIIAFLQYGDQFIWKSPPTLDVNDATLTTAKKNFTLTGVPSGLILEALFHMRVSHGTTAIVYLSNPNLTDLAPSGSATPLFTMSTIGTNSNSGQVRMFTDTSAQISARSSASSTTIMVAVLGWIDPRGKW